MKNINREKDENQKTKLALVSKLKTRIVKKPGWAFFELPKTQVDRNIPFSFNLYRFRNDGIIFLITGLIVPFVSLFLFRFLGGMGTDHPVSAFFPLLNLLVGIICSIVAIVYFYQKDSRLFIKSGLFIFYAFQIIPNLVSLIFSAFLGGVQGEVLILISLWLQILSEILIIALGMLWATDLRDRMVLTFKRAWKLFLIVCLVGTIVLVGISFLYGFVFQNTPLGQESSNQNSLTKILNTNSLGVKILGVISLFALTVIVAPLAEEMAARQAWYVGVGNRTIAWITSAIFFAMLHVSQGDVEHMLNYFLAGFILSTIFSLGRGNVTYNWSAHAGSNLVALIVTVAGSF